jgi:hypothetical protein
MAINDVADRPRLIRFERRGSPLQIVGIGGGALAFLGASAFLLTVAVGAQSLFDSLPLLLMVVVFGFFGLLMAAGAIAALRGARTRTAIAVGPDGIWLPQLGHLGWSDVAEVRLESFAGPAGGDDAAPRTATYRRLGIVPKDPTLAARRTASERLGWGLASAYYRFAAPRIGRRPIDFAPFGVSDDDLAAPLDVLVETIRPYHAVVGVRDDVTASTPAESPAQGTRTVHIGGRDIEIGVPEPSMGSSDAPEPSPDGSAETAADSLAEGRRRKYLLAAATLPRATSTAPPVMPMWASAVFLAVGIVTVWVALASPAANDLFPLALFALVFGGIGAYFMWRALRSAWLRRRLRNVGATANAEVIGIVNTHVQVNDVEMWVVHYGYQAPGGPRVGVSPSMPYAQASLWAPGDIVRVAYDPSNPGLSMWLEPRRS